MDNVVLSDKLVEYANSFGFGYLKSWKAQSIVVTLTTLPGLLDDEVRLLHYLKNCLEMEGFLPIDIELIMGWIYERLT